MRVERADIYVTSLTLNRPFVVVYETYTTMPSVLLALHTDSGLTGWGEAVPDQHVTGETIGTVQHLLRDELLPAVIGRDPRSIGEIHQIMESIVSGNGAAKAAIDIACHDLLGKATGLPIYQLFGGRLNEVPPLAYVVSIVPPDQAAKECAAAMNDGYDYIKVKLGGPDLREDTERVAAIRSAVGDDVRICVDANQGWGSVATAASVIADLEPYNLQWVEQPIPARQISGFKTLRNLTRTPLMVDESLVDHGDLDQLAIDRSVERVNIKLMKHGGIAPCCDLATQASLAGFRVQIGSMLESSVGSAAGFHVAVANPAIDTTELCGPLWFTADPGDLHYELPYARLSEAPGLGIEINLETLASITNEHIEVKA